jgi:hypothetical protein
VEFDHLRLHLKIAMRLACAASALTVVGNARAAEFTFIGNWYGVGEPDDPSISYIDSYSADGTFHSEFRKCQRGEVVWRQTETGKWSIAKGVLTMISDSIDGKPDRFDNSYRLEFTDMNEFHARLAQPDYLFVEKRLPKFEFPPCYVGS